jgi:hypothetical protein
MAYLIFQDNNLYTIAANDADKNSLPLVSNYTVKDVSESDFLKIKKHTSQAKLVDGNVVIEDSNQTSDRFNEVSLKGYHVEVLKKLNGFLKVDTNSTKSLYNDILNYKNYLDNLDYSTIPLPMVKTWEEYCDDNSIAYISPLQIG